MSVSPIIDIFSTDCLYLVTAPIPPDMLPGPVFRLEHHLPGADGAVLLPELLSILSHQADLDAHALGEISALQTVAFVIWNLKRDILI